MENNSLLKNFTKYVGLNIVGLVSSTIVILVDYIFVAMAMGADGLAAITFGVPVYTIVFAVGMMFGVGGGAKYAEHAAKGEQEQANNFFTVSLKTGCIFAIPLIAAGVFLTRQITGLLGADGHILYMTADYVRVVLLGSPIMLLYFILTSFERNDGSPKIAMIAGVIASAVNILMDFIFIIVLDLGAGGVSGATMVAMSCSLLFLLVYRLRHKANFRFVKTKLAIRKIATVCAIGGPSLLNTLLYSFLMITFNLVLYRLSGNIAVAAFGIITSLAFLVQNFFTGVGQGIQPIASYYYGKKNSDNLRKIALYAIATNVVLAVAVISMVYLFTDNIVAVFNTEQNLELAVLAREGLRIYFAAFLFFGTTIVTIAFLSVTSNPTFSLVVSFLQGGGLVIPIVLITSRLLGVTGVWLAYPISEFILIVTSVIFLVRANRFHRKKFREHSAESND